MLPNSHIIHALNDVGMTLESEEINVIFPNSDMGFDQFSQAAVRLRKSNEWAGVLLLHELLANSLPKKEGQHPLQILIQLSAAEFFWGCARLLVMG